MFNRVCAISLMDFVCLQLRRKAINKYIYGITEANMDEIYEDADEKQPVSVKFHFERLEDFTYFKTHDNDTKIHSLCIVRAHLFTDISDSKRDREQ